MSRRQDFEVFSGNDPLLRIQVFDSAGVVVDLTGVTELSWGFARLRKSSQNGEIQLGFLGPAIINHKLTGDGFVTVFDSANGIFEVAMQKADTENTSGEYYYESEITDSSGRKSTVVHGVMRVLPDLL